MPSDNELRRASGDDGCADGVLSSLLALRLPWCFVRRDKYIIAAALFAGGLAVTINRSNVVVLSLDADGVC